ncbi:MAG: gephyrin-like molybdotransferase Glp [Rhodospirillaceae bacterium]
MTESIPALSDLPAPTRQATDCFTGLGDSLLSVEEALAHLAKVTLPVTEIETIPVAEAQGRVLAEDIVSPINMPGFDNSAMDGYAIRLGDLSDGGRGERTTTLPVGLRIPAGHAAEKPLPPMMAARIFTGAPIPEGADTVVMQEDCQGLNGGQLVAIGGVHKLGNHIRRIGEDVAKDSTVLTAGTRLRANHLTMAAHVGQTHLPVYRRPRVAVFTTGDEVVEPGEPLPMGALYNANRRNLIAMAAVLEAITIDLGNLPDDPAKIRAALEDAADQADMIVTSGGVSVGEEDHVKDAVSALGALSFWRLRIKPGKPVAFGTVRGIPFMGLPGNPVSTFVTFLMVGRALLHRLSGVAADRLAPPRYQVPLLKAYGRKSGARREFPRAKLVRGEDGQQRVLLAEGQGSHMVSSMVDADGLVEITEGVETLEAGALVPFMPFTELLQ